MSNSQIVCGYQVTAQGGQPIAALAAELAAVPLDLTLPQLFGAIPIADVTTILGQTATRTITLQFAPAIPAVGTATQYGGAAGGAGPLKSIQLSNPEANGDYAAPPILSFSGGNPETFVKDGASYTKHATGRVIMLVLDAIIVARGSGYTGATTAKVVGGDVNPNGGRVATASPVINLGQIAGVTFNDNGFDYNTFPQVVFTDPGGGSGAVVFGGLSAFSLQLFNPGVYESLPGLVFTPKFQSMTPDTADQKTTLRGFMTRALTEMVRSPIVTLTPIVS